MKGKLAIAVLALWGLMVVVTIPVHGSELRTEDIDLIATSTFEANSIYYEGLYEPVMGIYFGASYAEDGNINEEKDGSKYNLNEVRNAYGQRNSAYLMHLPFGTSIESIQKDLEAADADSVAIVLVWEVHETYGDMSLYGEYIKETADYIRWLDVPVFMSYGSGVNVDNGITNPAEYAENFRYVSNTVREATSDIAMVWTMDDEDPADTDMYYPGDAYVDWIGIRSFTKPGEDALASIGTLVERYGDNKPVMLTEAGVARYARSSGDKLDDWAAAELGKLMTYVPAVYPQIKGIFLRNGTYDSDRFHYYDFHASKVVSDAFKLMITDDVFLKEVKQKGDHRLAMVDTRRDRSVVVQESRVILRTMLDTNSLEDYKVTYELDGKEIRTVTDTPFSYTLSISGLTDERHRLDVMVYEGNTLVAERPYIIVKRDEKAIIESGTYQVIDFSDIRQHWSESNIIEVSKRGIIVGSDGRFRPNDYITRAEVTSVVTKLGKLAAVQGVLFTDVSPDQWYYNYVDAAQDYLVGYGNSYFPDRYATREEIISALVRLKGLNATDLTQKDRDDFAEDYMDGYMVDAAYRDDMILAVKYNIVGGYEDGTLRPKHNMRRGELAKVIYTVFYQ